MTITGQYYDTQITAGPRHQRRTLPGAGAHGLEGSEVAVGRPEQLLRDLQELDPRRRRREADQVLDDHARCSSSRCTNWASCRTTSASRPSASFAKSQPLLAELSTYIKTDHYALDEAFDNIMPGSIDSYWYQTNNGVFSGALSPAERRLEHAVPDEELPRHCRDGLSRRGRRRTRRRELQVRVEEASRWGVRATPTY